MTYLIVLLFAALFACAIAGAVAYTHAQVWRERAERLSESEASYQALQRSLRAGGWVRLSSDEELERVKDGGRWN